VRQGGGPIEELSADHGRILDALESALALTENIQRGHCQAGPSERRLLNQAFFEWLKIEDEAVIDAKLTEPFDCLSASKHPAQPEAGPLLERLAPGWTKTASRWQMACQSGFTSPV
jgi:hypothetical protein